MICHSVLPVVCRRPTVRPASGWSLGSQADIIIQSVANRSNVLPLLRLTHLAIAIQLRAELHWQCCCDFMCLHEMEVFTVETVPSPFPSCCLFSYWSKQAAVRFNLFIVSGKEL